MERAGRARRKSSSLEELDEERREDLLTVLDLVDHEVESSMMR